MQINQHELSDGLNGLATGPVCRHLSDKFDKFRGILLEANEKEGREGPGK